jgi:diguanylate cyclase (GGDEF)-like protein
VLYGLVVVLATILLAVSPPTAPIGAAGWLVAAAILVAGAALAVALRRRRFGDWGALLLVSLAALPGLAILQWLAGGVGAPYDSLLLLPIFFAAAIHPPRTIALYMLAVAAVLAAPFAYDGWDSEEAAALGAGFVVWSALAVVINLMMVGIRAARLTAAREQDEALHEARSDSLTGLGNRRAFDEELEREVMRSRRGRRALCLAMVDIENFKQINDRWGYAEGDRCLCEVTEAVRDSLRDPDLCFRWGGDEFTLILPGISATSAEAIGDRLRETISSSCSRPDGDPVRARFAVVELQPGMPPEELIELAGIALTTAKTSAPR